MLERLKLSRLVASLQQPCVGGAARWRRRLAAQVRAFARDRNGATMVYVGVTMVALVGVGALSIDVGQMVVLRNEMQNAADSACLGAAAQLNGTAGARTRAQAVAQNIALDESGLASPDPVLTIEDVQFYQNWNDPQVGTVAASGDHTANYVRVDLLAKNVDFLLAPAFSALLGGGANDSITLDTHAVCQNAKLDCSTVPLLICSSTDPDDPASVLNPANRGRMTVAKEGPGSPIPEGPGEFGLLCVDDGGTLLCGAKDLGQAMASDTGNFCNPDGLTTAPGSKTNQLAWGMDARFGTGKYTSEGPPASNVVSYPRDPIYDPGGPGVTPLMGGVPEVGGGDYDQSDYVWEPKAYWNTYHPLEDPVSGNQYYNQANPSEPIGNPHFLNDGESAPVVCYNNGITEICDTLASVVGGLGLPQTIIDAPTIATWAEAYDPASGVTNPDPSLVEGAVQGFPGVLTRYKLYLYESYNNQPTNIPDGYDMSAQATSARERRVTRIAVVDCLDEGVKGKTTIPNEAVRYVDVFVTEPVVPPPDATYYAEIIGNPLGSGDYGAAQTEILNVRLLE